MHALGLVAVAGVAFASLNGGGLADVFACAAVAAIAQFRIQYENDRRDIGGALRRFIQAEKAKKTWRRKE